MKSKPKRSMTREEATELYKSLQNRMKNNPSLREQLRHAVSNKPQRAPAAPPLPRRAAETIDRIRGNTTAIALVIIFACAKVGISALEHFGFASLDRADASVVQTSEQSAFKGPAQRFSKEEIKVLTMLDARRTELEYRGSLLEKREGELREKERELSVRMNEMRSLTERLKVSRQQDDKKRENQIDQLSKVYGSMNPEEAAALMEQLDVSIALALLKRMPEKRIGQILALMSPERALGITRMLSGT